MWDLDSRDWNSSAAAALREPGSFPWVLKRFPLGRSHVPASYCRQRGEICTRARTASKVEASSSLCKKLGNVTLLDPDGKQTPLPFLDEIRIGSLADAVGAP